MEKLKIVSIVGARPQFVKAAALSRELRQKHIEVLVHTGQHYSVDMSDIFFEDLNIPRPDINLQVGSGNHGSQTGLMLSKIEETLLNVKPDVVLVYGDTNSTLAGALAAAKLHIPVVHVEAGLRSFNKKMPEEINRVLTDHISALLLCPSQIALENLAEEGITDGVKMVGDLMHDVLRMACHHLKSHPEITSKLDFLESEYFLATLHRAENTDDPSKLSSIVSAFNELNKPVILPLHPRTKKAIENANIAVGSNIKIHPPLGYFEMIAAQRHAKAVLTDSGGVQKEAYWLKIPCVTLRDDTEWVETVESGWNILVGSNQEKIIGALKNRPLPDSHPNFYGDGMAASLCLRAIADAPFSCPKQSA